MLSLAYHLPPTSLPISLLPTSYLHPQTLSSNSRFLLFPQVSKQPIVKALAAIELTSWCGCALLPTNLSYIPALLLHDVYLLPPLVIASTIFNALMLIVQDLKTRNRSWTSTRAGSSTPQIKPGVIVMKFGEQLRSSVIHEYQWYYIDYDALKEELKKSTGPPKDGDRGAREWTEDDETRFVAKLESELDKVHTKQKVKAMEISRRIMVSEREVKEVVNRLNERGISENGPSEEEFMLLEEDLSDIIADVHDLAKFVQLNYTGFYKIIKKHDVSAGIVTCLSIPNILF